MKYLLSVWASLLHINHFIHFQRCYTTMILSYGKNFATSTECPIRVCKYSIHGTHWYTCHLRNGCVYRHLVKGICKSLEYSIGMEWWWNGYFELGMYHTIQQLANFNLSLCYWGEIFHSYTETLILSFCELWLRGRSPIAFVLMIPPLTFVTSNTVCLFAFQHSFNFWSVLGVVHTKGLADLEFPCGFWRMECGFPRKVYCTKLLLSWSPDGSKMGQHIYSYNQFFA